MERRRIEASTSSPSAPTLPRQPLNPTPLPSNESRVFDFPAEADPLAPSGSGGADTIGGEKKRRGRPKRQAGVAAPRAPPPKRQAVRKRQAVVPDTQPMEADEDVWEDICFICFDGGSLVLCDFKGCPKAYHPACIKRDETYFQSKGKWNCGWHICSVCQRASHYMCYTCTYSLCKACIKETDYVCVRGNMGLCKVCMKTIMLIENKDQPNEESVKVDFDDITSWEYLFKLYWIYLKQSISLTLHEITQAKHLSQGVGSLACKQKLRDLRSGVNYEHEQITNGQSEQFNLKCTKDVEQSPSSGKITENGAPLIRCKEWASKELLEFVGHVKDGDTCVLSQFDVLELLLKYIKKNGLLDRDDQVVCDFRLTNLFGKPRVSQSEMLKLLECHLLLKDEPPKNSSTQAEMVGTASTNLEHSENKESSITQQNSCKKFDVGIPQNNLDEYAAIDAHNMNLIYLPRNLMGSLIQDEKFHEKVVGSIVRIRISNSDQKQDMYRLVPVRGSNKGPEPYKLGNKRVDTMLEVLNLDKKESIAIDTISDQEFSPDECRHLREIIKCGLVKPFTVGEVRKKAMELLSVRLDERLDAEILKLNQLCDQTSEQERIKELRLRISKLQLLKTPEECQRRFSGMIQVHTDSKMSPDYDSEQDAEGGADQKSEVVFTRSKSSEFDRSDCRHNSSEREEVSTRSKSSELDKSDCRHNSSEREEVFTRSKSSEFDRSDCRHNSSEREEVFTRSKSSELDRSNCRHSSSEREVKDEGLINGEHKVEQKIDESDLGDQAVSEPATENSAAAHEMESSSPMNESETEKLWYYRDPNDKIQGPFSIVQLREWSKTGYFPPDMKIWTIYEHEDSILLTEALNGQFHTAAHLLYNFSLQSHQVRGSSHENKDNSRRDKVIDGTLKAGTGSVQCRKSSETAGSDVLGGNSGVQSIENNKSGGVLSSENNESGRTDVLSDNNEYRKINVMVDTGSQSRENSEPGKTLKEMQPGHSPPQNYEPGKTNASLSESCDITASGLIPKDMQPAPHSPSQKHEPVKTDASLSESRGFTASGLIPKEIQPRQSRRRKLKEHTSSSTHHQIHQLPSPTNGTSHFSPHQGGGRGSEGYIYSPNHEKQESDVSAVVQAHENKSNAKSNENQSFGQNRRSFPINLNSKGIDLNSGLSPATNSDSSKQSCDMELPELPNRMAKEGNREPETDSAENSQLSLDVHPMPDPTSPMLKLSNESQVAHATEYKPPPSFKVEQDLHPSRSSASSLVVGGAQFQNISNDWGGYPQQPMKPVLEGWSSGLVSSSSLKQHEIAAPTANIDPLAHISACNPTPSTSSWHGIVEPIEFISLAEESVSDLLAEVDAMESQGGGLASPTSAMRYEDEMMKFCKNECFTIEDFSPTHNPGRSDALSSTRDIQLPSQSTATQEPVGASEGNIYDTPKRSSRHSSNSREREREARPSDVRVNNRDAAHPGLSLSMSQDINSAVPASSRMDAMDSGIMGRAPENLNPFWGVPPQGINSPGYATYQGTSYGNSNTNRSTHNTNGGLQWDGQRKYAGDRHPAPRDHATHGSDVGYSSRGRPSYNRQPFGGGGGYTRSPKGQRVCKFYESGHCRKGASCEYLHP